MSDFFFISYSSVDGKAFAMKLADELAAGPPAIPVWLDKRTLRPGEDWDEQIGEAIKTCKGMIFIMSADSVRPDSVCKNEWVRALKYKKPVIPLLLDREAELPFRLESREYINFSGAFDSAVARLRKHLTWMDSPEGQLQALKYRLSDAQRELPRAEPEQQARIREDIADLERQIAQQQRVIDNPKAAEQRVQRSIEVGLEGERKPALPVGGITQGKFVNQPPLIAPTWFQDRHFETGQIGQFLKDESLRLMTVVGRGGVGKSAMVCRLLRSLQGGQLPDDGGALTVDGIVYLSAARSFHRPDLPDLYAGLAKLLPDETVKRLDSVYKNPQASTRATVEALVQAFPHGRTIVLLDNFEDMLTVETGQIKDAELDDALRAILELPPHGLKIIITTRVVPRGLALVQPGLQRRLDLDAGLETPFAENILRAMDADGKVGLRDAPDALLARARERTRGYPRALEHLFGILSADRDTSLQEILDDTRKVLPEQVVGVLVGEAFSRLDLTAQRVMQALAIYRYPVPPAAVDYLLQTHISGIDSSRVLSRLVNMQFARRDAGRYYLHQVDRDYALSRIAEGQPDDREAESPPLTRFALRHWAAEWFKLSRKPREAWKTLSDLAAQLSEFELRCESNNYDTAATVLLELDGHLLLWGHYRLITELHERLRGRITDPELAISSMTNLGSAYYRMGQIQTAIDSYEQALHLARKHGLFWVNAVLLGYLANCFGELGLTQRAMEDYRQALDIVHGLDESNWGAQHIEAQHINNIGYYIVDMGDYAQSLEYHRQALTLSQQIGDRQGESIYMANLGIRYHDLGHTEKALEYCRQSLVLARGIGDRYSESVSLTYLGDIYLDQGTWDKAIEYFETSLRITDEINNLQFRNLAEWGLAFTHLRAGNVSLASFFIGEARNREVPRTHHAVWSLTGVIFLRCGDQNEASKAFSTAITEADRLLAHNERNSRVLDSKALALCGLTLCGMSGGYILDACKAYRAAREITCDAGIVARTVALYDALAQADTEGILAEVRPVAAGMKAA